MPLSAHPPGEVEGHRVVEIAVGEDSPSEDEFRFHTVGEQLKAERERLGFSLADLAARTRVPMRHLESIEKSDFSALPGSTYTLGFARSYARAVELDAIKISADLRSELAQSGHEGYQAPLQNYEPTDPARVPSRTLAWTAAAIGVLFVAGYFIWRSMTLDGSVDITMPVPFAEKSQIAAPAPKAAPPPSPDMTAMKGPVILTATDTVWVKVYDAENKRLYEKEMQSGDSYTVPADANKPMIVTGRPEVLTVTVGGKTVPSLGPPEKTVADLEISAQALLARTPTANPAP
ncbi:helix-turn-helix domain-containing protein [Sphingorhabdus sp. IMCC26285]|uniref:Helix-turn-helix domain-containing protein n=1 Tax=Sphingorhabdus profundilacus TaxID=2509718 RepID=A0A6I4LYU7_9SPHN|nr:helix-turn-helix domain-containing protein [Sphingorhabdus profundilacus]MVZ98727.1 helix-turn-helix domain-containing protein [Sphingorhabdus profundilacus]